MEYFIQQLINGPKLGSIYGLIAIGYTTVYGIIRMINFAHGDVFMIGSFIALMAFLLLTSLFGSAFLPVVLLLVLTIAMLFCVAWGWSVERIAYAAGFAALTVVGLVGKRLTRGHQISTQYRLFSAVSPPG